MERKQQIDTWPTTNVKTFAHTRKSTPNILGLRYFFGSIQQTKQLNNFYVLQMLLMPKINVYSKQKSNSTFTDICIDMFYKILS